MTRIQKTIYGLIEDLENHLYLLDKSIKDCLEHPSNFIQMAGELRVLVTRGSDHEDLLLLIARELKLKMEITLKSDNKKITFSKYLHSKDVFIKGEWFSNIGFIKLMCNHSGEFLHVQKTIDERVILGNSINLFGINANNRQLLSIARSTSNMAHDLITHIKNMDAKTLKK